MEAFTQSTTAPEHKDLWESPDEVFDIIKKLTGIEHFDVDVAANAANHKAPIWMGEGSPVGIEDCLQEPWDWKRFGLPEGTIPICYMNCPYSGPRPFVDWAAAQAAYGNATTVCLLPASTDTGWFHDYINVPGAFDSSDSLTKCWFLRGRIRFISPATKKPVKRPISGSIIVLFRARPRIAEVPHLEGSHE